MTHRTKFGDTEPGYGHVGNSPSRPWLPGSGERDWTPASGTRQRTDTTGAPVASAVSIGAEPNILEGTPRGTILQLYDLAMRDLDPGKLTELTKDWNQEFVIPVRQMLDRYPDRAESDQQLVNREKRIDTYNPAGEVGSGLIGQKTSGDIALDILIARQQGGQGSGVTGAIYRDQYDEDDNLIVSGRMLAEQALDLESRRGIINKSMYRIQPIAGKGGTVEYQLQSVSPTVSKAQAEALVERYEVVEIADNPMGGKIMELRGFGKDLPDTGYAFERFNADADITKEDVTVSEQAIPGTDRVAVNVIANNKVVQSYNVAKAKAAFEPGTKLIDGKRFVETAEGKFSPFFDPKIEELGGREFLRDQSGQMHELQKTYDPGTYYDATTDRYFARQPNGTIQALPRDYVPGVVEDQGREFLVQPTGVRTELQRQYDPGFITDAEGRTLIQQPTGAVSQPRPANMDEIITQALIDGDWDKALAFQDFKNRPTAMEAFQAALNFARSPADQQLISSLARGEVTVDPPTPGQIRRVGPQPDFLVEEYNTFQQRLRAGRQPSQAEQSQYLQRHMEGRSPYTDQVDEANANLTSQLEDARSLARTQKEDFNRELGKFRNELIRLQSEPVGGGGGSDAGTTRGQKGGDFGISNLAGSGAEIYGSSVDSSAGIRNIRQLAAQFGADTNGNMPQGQLSFPGVTVTGQARKANLQGAKFNDFRAWVIAAKEEGVTDAGLSTYIAKKLTDFESDALNHPDLKLAMGVMGVSSLEGATITGTFSQNMAAGAPAASAGDVDVEAGADGTRDIEEIDYGRGALGVSELFRRDADEVPELLTMADLYSMRDEIRDKRRADQEQRRIDLEREREQAQAAARRDISTAISAGTGIYAPQERRDARASLPMIDDTDDDDLAYRGGGPVGAPAADFSFAAPSVPSRRPQSRTRPVREEPRLSYDQQQDEGFFFAKGGVTRGDNLEVVGEEGPELVDLPPGTHVIPFQQLNRRQLRQLQRDGVPGYAGGGVVFGSETLPLGLRQLQAGRQITPSRGYLSQQAGLTIPSVQAFQNLTPESRDIFRDTAMQAGIPARAFEQELALARPGGRRLPLARFQPTTRRGIR